MINIIYAMTAVWLGYTSIVNGCVCDWVPTASEHCMLTARLSSRARDLFSYEPLRQSRESWSPAAGSGLLQGTWQVSDTSGSGARSLFFLINLVPSIIWCSVPEPGEHCGTYVWAAVQYVSSLRLNRLEILQYITQCCSYSNNRRITYWSQSC